MPIKCSFPPLWGGLGRGFTSVHPFRGICIHTMIINGFKIRKYNSFGLPLGYAALLAKKSSRQGLIVSKMFSNTIVHIAIM